MSFAKRFINVKFSLGEGAFGDSGANSVNLIGHRVTARIVKAGGPSMGTAQLSVYGMKLDQMNRLSTLGMAPTLIRRNIVTVEAGDEGGQPTTVFVGTITNAWADMRAAPQVPFQVEAHAGLIEAVQTADATSYTGPTQVATIMSSLASKMGLSFENNGVDAVLNSPYFSGSYRSQAQACAEAAGINWIIDNAKLAIWKASGQRGDSAPLVSPQTGMVNSPTFTSKGISVQTLFNPSIGYGSAVEVKSFLTPACGRWVIYRLDHDLAAELPGGPWFSTFEAARPGLVVVA